MNESLKAPGQGSPGSYFADDYQEVMYTGAIGIFSELTHKLLDWPFRKTRTPVILEVGAGVGQHAKFALTDFDRYFTTDLSEEAIHACQTDDPRVTAMVADAQQLSAFGDASVDRVIATCLLAHLSEPEKALQEWRRVLKPGGSISIYVPAEPGMLLRLLRQIFVVPKSRRLGNNHLEIIYRDHRNHYPSMRLMIRSVFSSDAIRQRRFPTRLVGWNFALFDIFHITKS